jgi:predicted RNA binding protein YcfA (HicA-like mRNA interferase family)
LTKYYGFVIDRISATHFELNHPEGRRVTVSRHNRIKLVEDFILRKMSTKPSLEPNAEESRVKGKGRHASSTENRRMVWEKIIWPLVLDVNRSYFSLKEYHVKRDQFCQTYKIRPSKVAGGVVSLLVDRRKKHLFYTL